MIIKATFLPGTDISDAFREAIDFATRNNVCVEFNFNGVICHAYRFCNVEKEVRMYHQVLEYERKKRN